MMIVNSLVEYEKQMADYWREMETLNDVDWAVEVVNKIHDEVPFKDDDWLACSAMTQALRKAKADGYREAALIFKDGWRFQRFMVAGLGELETESGETEFVGRTEIQKRIDAIFSLAATIERGEKNK